jgi:hypothetical protein
VPIMAGSISVPANAVINPFNGQSYEILPFHANISIAFNQQTGALGAVLATVYAGTDLLAEEGAISVQARAPVYPDDYYIRDSVAANDRIKANLRNTTGGAIVVAFSCHIDPI